MNLFLRSETGFCPLVWESSIVFNKLQELCEFKTKW